MTHEVYLAQLIHGFVGDSQAGQPDYNGADEEDAVCRWLAYHVAMYVHEHCRFEPDERGGIVFVFVNRVWYQWRYAGKEDVDLVLFGLRSGQRNSRAIKVTVDQPRPNVYLLRISDWTTSQTLDQPGQRRDGRGNGVLIFDPRNPHLSTMTRRPVRAQPQGPRLILPDCCRRSLGGIRTVLSGNRQLETMLENVKDTGVEITSVDWEQFAGHAEGMIMPVQRERLRAICEQEIASHVQPSLVQFWGNMMRSLHLN